MKKCLLFFFALSIISIQAIAQVPGWQWAQSAGEIQDDRGSSVTTDNNGNVLVTGYFYSPGITFGSTTLTNSNPGFPDIYVVKYDASGNVLWAKSAGGSGYDFGTSITTDVSGNVIVTGNFHSPNLIFGTDTLTLISGQDFFIVKYDATGNVLWARCSNILYPAYVGQGVTTDSSGNVFLTGWFSGSISFGSAFMISEGLEDMFIVKYDASGNVLWAKQAGGSNIDRGSGIATDVSGNVLITGQFKSPFITLGTDTLANAGGTANYDMFIVKYDTLGNLLWAKSAGESNTAEYGNSVASDGSGNVLVTGHFFGYTLTFGTITLTNGSPAADMFIVKYDAAGNVLWAKGTGGIGGDDIGRSVATDLIGNVLVAGYFYSNSITFGTTTLTNPPWGGNNADLFIVKYNHLGDVLWAKNTGGHDFIGGFGIAADVGGSVYVTGHFSDSTISIGGAALPYAGSNDMFIAKLDSPACSAFYTLYADTIPHNWIAVNQATGTAPVTYAWNWGDGSPVSNGATPSHTYSSPGYYNICLAITDANGCSAAYCDTSTYLYKNSSNAFIVSVNVILPTGISEQYDHLLISIYPNPSLGVFTITFPEIINNGKLEIISMLGEKVHSESLANESKKEIQLNSISQGIYIVQLFDGINTYNRKIIFE